MIRATAFWVTGPGVGAARTETLPPAGENEVLVRALASGVSRGTEALVFAGRVPPAQYEAMRARQCSISERRAPRKSWL